MYLPVMPPGSTILRVQIDTNSAWVLSFLHLLQMPEYQHFSEWQMHPSMGGYRFFESDLLHF